MTRSRVLKWITGALLVGAGVLVGALATPLARAWSAADVAGETAWAKMAAACTAFMQSQEGQAHHRAMMQMHAQYGASSASPPATDGGAETR